jgi:hypothetical protein
MAEALLCDHDEEVHFDPDTIWEGDEPDFHVGQQHLVWFLMSMLHRRWNISELCLGDVHFCTCIIAK